jgi:hypothetical protein
MAEHEELKDISLLMALGAIQRAGTVKSLLWQARDICMRADDPAYHAVMQKIDEMFGMIPDSSSRLARALGVEPEGLDYYDGTDHISDLNDFRRARGLPVEKDEDDLEAPPPFEHPADIYSLLCKSPPNPDDSSGG